MAKIAIIGGGACGIMAALEAAKRGAKVTLFEQNSSLGKKLAMAGNGRCNITNTRIDAQNYFCSDKTFVNAIINTVNFNALQKILLDLGIALSTSQGQVFPLSYDGKNVVAILQNHLQNRGVEIHCSCNITKIEKNSSFTLYSKDTKYEDFEKLLLCSGSNAYIKHPAQADYALANDLGLRTKPSHPSLVQLKLKQNHHELASGVKVDAKITMQIENNTYEKSGDLLFTPYGISGLTVLDLSHYACAAIHSGKKVILKVDLFARTPQHELESFLKMLYKRAKPQSLELFLKSFLHAKVAKMLIAKYNLAQTINPKVIKKLCYIFKGMEFEVHSCRELKYAEVAGGGVSVEEVDKQTLMSKKIPNLYLGGEVLDVVGQRGGYNLHFALACGVICGKNMA
ncbi:MAG: aminoacetone oxidase family FAD-binding enzyme [Campylobacterota bacterium]